MCVEKLQKKNQMKYHGKLTTKKKSHFYLWPLIMPKEKAVFFICLADQFTTINTIFFERI